MSFNPLTPSDANLTHIKLEATAGIGGLHIPSLTVDL